jgi:hypothetical protein
MRTFVNGNANVAPRPSFLSRSRSLALLLCALRAAPALAQINTVAGSSNFPVGATASFQGAPAVTTPPAGNSVVVWQKQSATTGGWDIFGRLVADAGNPPIMGAEFQVSPTGSTACRRFPAVASDAFGNFVVVWQSNEESGGVTGIFGQRFNNIAQPQGAEFQVNVVTADADLAPAVAMSPDGRFFVAWQSNGEDGSGWGIYGRSYAAGGGSPSGEIAVNQTTAGGQHSPGVAFLAGAGTAGGFAVVWQSEGQDGTGSGASGILARIFNPSGNPLSAEIPVNAPMTGSHGHPRIASDPSGNFVVVWEDVTGAGSTVLARRFTAVGAALSTPPLMIDAAPAGAPHNPAAATDARGDFVVVWDRLGQDGSGTAVVAQQFDNQQNPKGGTVQLNTTTAGDQSFAGVGLSAGGSLLAAWQSQTAAGEEVDGRVAMLQEMSFYTVFPCRIVDTRNATGPLGGPQLSSGVVRNFPLLSAASNCNLPATAKALSINVTVVQPTTGGSLVVYPGDAPVPPTNTVSANAGDVLADNLVVLLSLRGDGSANVLARLTSGTLHFLIDVNGYFK